MSESDIALVRGLRALADALGEEAAHSSAMCGDGATVDLARNGLLLGQLSTACQRASDALAGESRMQIERTDR